MTTSIYPYRLLSLISTSVISLAGLFHLHAAEVVAKGVGGRELFVSTSGDDANTGLKGSPLATLSGARDAIRKIKSAESLPAGGITVYFARGVYSVKKGIRFTAQDSGEVGRPITYKAFGGHQVSFSGGVSPSPSLFKPVSDPAVLERIPREARGEVLVLDVSNNLIDLGQVPFRGHSLSSQPWLPRGKEPPELIFNGKPMTVARWPNEGFTRFARIIEEGSRPRSGARPTDSDYRTPVLAYDGNHPSRWATAPDSFLHGYWGNEWSDQTIQIESISPENQRINLAQASTYGIEKEHRYFVFNLLEELDQPGEWYLDRKKRKLYFYPPGRMEGANITLTQLTEPILQLEGASHLIFSGLTFEAGRSRAVNMNQGQKNRIEGCTIRNFAGAGINIKGGYAHGVQSCHIHGLGTSGISLAGGDAVKLTPSGHFALNNHIHDFARIVRTYQPAIRVSGVGQRVAHNEIHNAPHLGISYSGNNHLFEYNIIYNIAKETGDVGGIYSGRNWISRGNVIRYNLFHSMAGLEGGHGAFPIYFDDGMSGALVHGNIIHGSYGRAVLIGGGHDIEVSNNLFLECHTPVGIDDRLLNWGAQMLPALRKGLESVANRSAWKEAYPGLADILIRKPDPSVPNNNVIKNNLLYKSGLFKVADKARPHTTIKNNLETDRDPSFTDSKNFDFSFPEDSWIYKEMPGFEAIPFDKIGRYDDGLNSE